MKKLMFAAIAAISMIAVAQESAIEGEGTAPVPVMGPRQGGPRGGRMPGMIRAMGGAMQDPIVNAVMNPKVAEKIGLADEQKAKLKEIQPKRGENKEINAKVQAGMKKQMELLQAETIDEAAVMAAIDEVFEARKAMAKEQTKRLIAIRAILTPEQIKAAREAMKELRGPRARQ